MKFLKVCLFLLLCSCNLVKNDISVYKIHEGIEIMQVPCIDYDGFMYSCVSKATQYCNGNVSLIGYHTLETEEDDKAKTEVLPYTESSSVNWLNENAPTRVLHFYCKPNFWD